MSEIAALTETSAPAWPTAVAAIYAAGVVVALFLTLRSICNIYSIIRKGTRKKEKGYTLVVIHRADISPFSWGRYIVVPAGISDEDFRLIVAHEKAHLHHHHWIDLALGQAVVIFNWFNPAAFLMMKELQDVHEFEADREVVKSGINEKEYQMLLVRNVTGSLFPLFADSLNHSQLKSRIKLMASPQSNPFRRFWATLIIPAMFAVIMGLNTPLLASTLGTIATASIFATDYNDVRYTVDGSVHSISYDYEGMTNSVSMEVDDGSIPKIYINRHLSSKEELRNIKAEDVDFILTDNIHNRFVVKTK